MRSISPRTPSCPALLLLLCLLVTGAGLTPAHAQRSGDFGQSEAPVPRIEAAESDFRSALGAFQSERYGVALDRFDVVVNAYPLHRKTTAAALMAGKALYRRGEYARAAERLSRFVRDYPSSGYVGEARRVRGYAREQLGLSSGPGGVGTLQLGIALPLGEQDVALTQSMFDGIALAVARRNVRGGGAPVRMIFRDTGGNERGAREALRALAAEGADVVVGPLYSRTARPAGAVAEEERLPMIAPLATDQGVSQGRRYVFQANPTMAMRGRQMARFAGESLRKDRFGVVSQPEGTLSHQLAQGFRAEAQRQGAEVVFSQTLADLRAYGRLNERIPADALADAEVVFMPVSGGQAPRLVQAALTALDRADVPRLRVLGNGEWHDLPIEQAASRYRVTYFNAFRVDPTRPPVQAFVERFRDATGSTPDQLTPTGRRLAYTGYDVTRFLLEAYRRSTDGPSARPLVDVLREVPRYEGLGLRIDFRGGNVNEALFYHRYRNGRLELLR